MNFTSCPTDLMIDAGSISFIIMVQDMAGPSSEYNQDTTGALHFTQNFPCGQSSLQNTFLFLILSYLLHKFGASAFHIIFIFSNMFSFLGG
jgi:hypothetical protein